MTDYERLKELSSGAGTEKWAAYKIIDLEIRLHRISGILHGMEEYNDDDVLEMKLLCDTSLAT
jgi:hypothetical protein